MIDPLDTKARAQGAGQAGHPPRHVREGPRRLHHRQRDQGPRPASATSACPSQKRTYGVNVKAEPSTRFADWIETNLLKLDASQDPQGRVRQLQGRPRAGLTSPGEILDDRAQGLGGPWTIGAASPPGQELNTEKIADADRRPGRPQDRRRPAQARRPDPRPEARATRRGSRSTALDRSPRSRARAST